MTLLNGILLIAVFLILKWFLRLVFVTIILKTIKKNMMTIKKEMQSVKESQEMELKSQIETLVSDYQKLNQYTKQQDLRIKQFMDFVDDVEFVAFHHLASEELRNMVNHIKGV